MQSIWTLMSLMLLMGIGTSCACQCEGKYDSIQQEYCNCSLVLQGTVISKEEIPVLLSDALRDYSSYSFPLGVIETIPPPIIPGDFDVWYVVEVNQVLKDVQGNFTDSQITLITSKDPEMCGVPDLKVGETYLFQLFSYSGLFGICDGVYPYEEAQRILDLLRLPIGEVICDDETILLTVDVFHP